MHHSAASDVRRSVVFDYRRDTGPAPKELEGWRFQLLAPPYEALVALPSIKEIPHLVLGRLAPVPGLILVARPGDFARHRLAAHCEWLLETYPWLAIAVAPDDLPASHAVKLISRSQTRGMVVLPLDSRGVGAGADIAKLVQSSFDPETSIADWLLRVVPYYWPVARGRAQQQFLAGYRYDPETRFVAKEPPARHAGVWFQWGRAIHATREVQALNGPKRPGEISRVVEKAGYFDRNSMQKALLGVFGLRPVGIRGTAGVEWLLWRALCGLGTAKRKRWDKVPPY